MFKGPFYFFVHMLQLLSPLIDSLNFINLYWIYRYRPDIVLIWKQAFDFFSVKIMETNFKNNLNQKLLLKCWLSTKDIKTHNLGKEQKDIYQIHLVEIFTKHVKACSNFYHHIITGYVFPIKRFYNIRKIIFYWSSHKKIFDY